MILKKTLIVALSLICFSCTEKKHSNTIISNKKRLKTDTLSSHNAYIIGTADDEKIIKFFSLQPETNYKKKQFKDSLFIKLDSIYQPKFHVLYSLSKKGAFFTRVIISPGDTVHFKIKDKQLRFIGKNANANNFYLLMNESVEDYKNIYYDGSLLTYKAKIKDVYRQRLNFFNSYIKKYPGLSKEFIYKVKEDLKFNYLRPLVLPNDEELKTKRVHRYVNSGQSVTDLLADEKKNDENLFDFADYYDNISIKDFKKPELLDNEFFIICLNHFINDYFTSNEYINFSKEKFLEQKRFIEENFDGAIKNNAIARMIIEYYEKGFGYSKGNIGLMKDLINNYENNFTKQTYKDRMIEIKENLSNFKYILPDNVLDYTRLVNPIGDTINLRKLFEDSSNKIRVIDFWSSRCPPCIMQIKEGKQFKNKLAKENNVEWIYISVDRDKNSWLKKIFKLQEFMNTEHQYLVLGAKNSSLAKELRIIGIPKYVIFDKNKQIILNNAPKPSDSIVFKKVIDEINSGKY